MNTVGTFSAHHGPANGRAFVLSPETTVNLCGGSGYIPPHDGFLFLSRLISPILVHDPMMGSKAGQCNAM
ncbi:MAG: hypothetical protein WA485_15820 [Candidatus Sulfotelmatobacter sp.]